MFAKSLLSKESLAAMKFLTVMFAGILLGNHFLEITKQNMANLCVLKRRDMKVLSFCSNYSGWLFAYLQTSEQAISTLENSINHKRHPIIQLRLGEHYLQQGRDQEALAIWKDALDSDLYFANRSIYWAKLGNLEEAMAMVEIVERLHDQPDPDKRFMYDILCSAWQTKGEYLKALKWCQLHAETRPGGRTYLTVATVQTKLQQYDDALFTLAQILDRYSEEYYGIVYQKKAEIYQYRGQTQDAVMAYKIALEHGVSSKWFKMGFAQSLLSLGDDTQACYYFEQALLAGYQPSITQRSSFETCDVNFLEN